MAQKTEHPADLNKWGPLRVSNVLRSDKWIAGPWVGRALAVRCFLCAAGPNGVGCSGYGYGVRGYLWVHVLGGLREVALPCSVNVRVCCMGVFSVRSGPVAWHVLGTVGGACSVSVRACCVCVGAWWAIFCGVSGFCCVGVFCVLRVLCAVWALLGGECSVDVRAPPYLCVWSGCRVFCVCHGACCVDVFRVRLGPMAWPVPGTAGVAGVRGYL